MHTSKPVGFGLILAATLALIGVTISAVLLQRHAVIEVGGNPLLSGMCEVSERASCDAVLSSEWGSFRGLPTALWGLFYFAAMASWFIVVGRPNGGRRWLHVPVVLAAAAGAGIAGGLAYIMHSRLPEWCPLCTATHAIAGVLFVLALLLWPRKPAAQPAREDTPDADGGAGLVESSWPPLRLVVGAVLLAVTASGFAWSEYHRHLAAGQAEEYLARWQEYETDWQSVYHRYMSQPQVQIPILPEDSIRGAADAPHTIVVFSDFQCPHCRNVDRVLRKKLEKHEGYFRLVFKHFPMNRDCNRYVQGRTNPAACAAAATAEAAYILGGDDAFWAMHDAFFENPGALARLQTLEELTRKVCGDLGIDYDELKAQFATRSVWSRVDRHVEQASGAGVGGTPVVFLDDRRVTGWVNRPFWDWVARQAKQKERGTRRPGQAPPRSTPPPATQPQATPVQ